MKALDEDQIENLLQGTIKDPSPRFEAALRAIPGRVEAEGRRHWITLLKPLALAASVLLILTLFLKEASVTKPADAMVSTAPLLDEEWVELFSLADALASAESLSDDELLPALEYYAFHQ